jgi:hypothetical protein
MLMDQTSTNLPFSCFESPLSGARSAPQNFLFHLMFFPAASFLFGEGFSMVAVIAWIAAIESGVVPTHLPLARLTIGSRRIGSRQTVIISSCSLAAKRRPAGRLR